MDRVIWNVLPIINYPWTISAQINLYWVGGQWAFNDGLTSRWHKITHCLMLRLCLILKNNKQFMPKVLNWKQETIKTSIAIVVEKDQRWIHVCCNHHSIGHTYISMIFFFCAQFSLAYLLSYTLFHPSSIREIIKFVTTVLNSPVSTTELGRITSTKQNRSSPGTRQSDIRQMRGEMTSF